MMAVGLSLTAVTVIAVVLVTVRGGAVPVCTASTVVMVRLSWPWWSWSDRYIRPVASARVALMALTLPVSVTVRPSVSYRMWVLSRPEATSSRTVRVPCCTVSVTVMSALPASGSITRTPAKALGVSSAALRSLGSWLTGRV